MATACSNSRVVVTNTPLEVQQTQTALDAFARQRMSEPYTIFDSKQVSDNQPLFFDEVTNGTGNATYNPGDASVTMAVLADGDYVIRQSFMRFDYQPGKGQLILLTGILGNPEPDTETRLGYFNSSASAPYTANRDGIWFGTNGTSAYVAIGKSGVENVVLQENWNYDRMDGSKSDRNPSGIELDFDLVGIYGISFEWLGVGTATMFVFYRGMPYPVHTFNHAFEVAQTGVYMSSPNHSVRYEVRSTGGVQAIKHICTSVISEGGRQPSGVTRSINNGTTPVSCSTSEVGILYYRLNSDRLCTTIELAEIGVLNTANNTNNYKWSIWLNPTIAGTAPTFIQESNSSIEKAVGVSGNILTGGTLLESGYASGNTPQIQFGSDLIINVGSSIDGTPDVIALGIQTFAGADTFVGSLGLREITCG